MHHIKKRLPDEDYISFLIKVIKENKNLERVARFSSISHLLKEGYILDAAENCEYLIKDFPEGYNKSYLYYHLFKINLEYLRVIR